ncbi:MAG: hypothetical protein V1838_04780 [Patescibacteria group bacterium]
MSTLKQCWNSVFCWNIEISPLVSLVNAEVVMALSFGRRRQEPGIVNVMMTETISHLSTKYQLPVIAQAEIADCLSNLEVAGVVRRCLDGRYLDTHEVVRQMAAICRRYGWKRAVIVAHPHHLWRVVKVAEKFGLKLIIPNIGKIRYDSHSVQLWTRSAWLFIPREILVRWLYLIQKKI